MNSYNVGAAAAVARALAAKSITIIGGGQSNTVSAYANLYYTPSAFAINGADKVITIPAGYSLKLGDTVYAKQAGATPSSYNDAAYQPYVVGGTMPSGLTLTGPANGASGALSVAGTVQIDMARSYPQAFASLTKKGVTAPLPPARGMNAFTFGGRPNGSPLFALRDRLAELSGADVHVANCGIGSTSLIGDWVGQIQGWVATSRYRVRRTAVPGDPGYFVFGGTGIANNNNVLWGEYSVSIPSQNVAWGDTVVHIEASATDPTTNGVPDPPFTMGAPVPDYTFYGRRVGVGAADNREALAQEWQAGYAFDKWSDGNMENPRTVKLTSDLTLTASFKVDTTGGGERGARRCCSSRQLNVRVIATPSSCTKNENNTH